MLYSIVKKYTQNFDGIPVANVTLKIHVFSMKLKAKVEMKKGFDFILESYPLEENHQFEERLTAKIYYFYKKKTLKELLLELNACEKFITWAGNMTIEKVVKTCHSGDWLLWLAQKINMEIRPLIPANELPGVTSSRLWKDEMSKKAIEVAKAFSVGKATSLELKVADALKAEAEAAYALLSNTYGAYTYGTDARTQDELKTADICRKYIGQHIIDKVNGLL